MKKLVTTIAFCMTAHLGYALPIGNPSEPTLFCHETEYVPCFCSWDDVFGFGIGFYGDYVFQRHLKTDTNHDLDKVSLYTNAAYLVANFWERVDIFATLGVTNFFFNTTFGPFNGPGISNPFPGFQFESGPSFSWSIGSRAAIWQCGCTTLGIEGQYFSSNASLKRFTIASGASEYLSDQYARYSEWQFGAAISYETAYFIPYVGVKYAHAFWNFGNEVILFSNDAAELHNLKNSKNWGYAVGVTYSPFDNNRVALSVEGRFADETALYVNGQVRF